MIFKDRNKWSDNLFHRPGFWVQAGVWFLAVLLFLIGLNMALLPRNTMHAHPIERQVKVLNPEEVVRLHIVAHSDSPGDQALKNALAHELRIMLHRSLEGDSSKTTLLKHLDDNLENIENYSREFLFRQGVDNPVSVALCSRKFPAREYAGALLPPGEYQALYVSIGDGMGENWWCLLFPPLCFHVFPVPEAVEEHVTAENAARQQKIAQENDTPAIRFWFLEKIFGK